ASRLANGERPGMFRVDVPVAVLGDVSDDRTTQSVPVQALVLVVEDVSSVTAQLRSEIRVLRSRIHFGERLCVIRPNRPRDVVVDAMRVLGRYFFAHPALKVRRRGFVWEPTRSHGVRRVVTIVGAPASFDRWKLADRIPDSHDFAT